MSASMQRQGFHAGPNQGHDMTQERSSRPWPTGDVDPKKRGDDKVNSQLVKYPCLHHVHSVNT